MTITADPYAPTPAASDDVRERQPRWVRPALLALLTATAVLYLWGLGSAGWTNSYYAAAAQAGTQNLTAWLFGSHDPGNAITVDKPPAALWVMALSGRLFGFTPFTMLLPQALMGVGAVALLFGAVRRCSGPAAGLIAGGVLALTPVAALMFRYNNPDALLVLLLVAAAYFTVRAIETAGTKWLALAGCALGFAFLTKMLQAFLVAPGLALAFLVAAPVGLWQRAGRLLVGTAALVVSAGWYVALVSLWPAQSRPYIGGSTDNSLLQLALGYNGLQRMIGHGGPAGGGPPGPPPGGHGGPGAMGNLFFGGEPGIGRMFGMSMGTEASWLLPAALIGLAATLWLTRKAARTDAVRASLLLWGGWLLVTAAVFSFMDGTIHPYYTVALAPGIAAVLGISVCELWRVRERLWARLVLATMSAATGVWAWVLLGRTPEWLPALRWIVLVGSLVAAVMLVVGAQRRGRTVAVMAAGAIVFASAAPAAYAVETVATPHNGPISMSGPSKGHAFGPGPGGPGGHMVDNAALAELVQGRANRWAAATIGSFLASDLELNTGASIMAIGGFTGGDNSPTLAQFQDYVANHEVRYFIDGGHFGPPGHRNHGAAGEITAWVKAHFTPVEVGGATVYDLQQSA
ncbi:glycosyl transferase [Mycolicibacterium agri]|uniref:Glycosyl transferase n=1 Tax=Mycolicibacterium agri TaxID=36811 RepID=A0A2A7N8G0_MYCAG|nr:glycosyltransferase family 39 protein [Mycolicibacterium agri]PEG40007.1 glycosyl transferase [Mycolicibacterium agri]GFG51519.1 glycosyl transferase [Mycolicibacterium agri]